MRDYHLDYPGLGELRPLMDSLAADAGGDSNDVSQRVLSAIERGVPLEFAVAALEELFRWLIRGLPDGRLHGSSPPRARALEETLQRPTARERIPLLSGEGQLAAWHVLDILHGFSIQDLPLSKRIADATRFVDAHPVPAFNTAFSCHPGADFDDLDDAASGLPLLRFVEKHADSPEMLMLCDALRHDKWAGLAEALEAASGTARRALLEMAELDRYLTHSVFGADYSVQKIGLLSSLTFGRKEAVGLVEQREALVGMLVGAAAGAKGLGKAYEKYLEGRINLGTNAAKSAEKLFQKAITMGFPARVAVMHLALSYNFRKKPNLTRPLLEEWAPKLGIQRGSLTTTASTIAKAYAEAGGDPVSLGSEDPARPFEAAADRNTETFTKHAERLGTGQREALAGFWRQQRTALVTWVAKTVTAEAIDAAVDEALDDRPVAFPPAALARLQIEENPTLAPFELAWLLAASRGEGSARAIAGALLTELRVRAADDAGFRALTARCPALATATALGVARVREAFGRRPADARVVLVTYATTYRWSGARLASVFTAFQERCIASRAWSLLAEAGETLLQTPGHGLDATLSEATRTALGEVLAGTRLERRGVEVAERLLAFAEAAAAEAVHRWWRAAGGVERTRDGDADAVFVGERLLGRVAGSDLATLRGALFDAYRQQLAAASPTTPPEEAHAKLRSVAKTSDEADDVVADWLERGGDDTSDAPLEELMETATWGVRALASDSKERARAVVRRLAERVGAARWSPGRKVAVLTTALESVPDDPAITAILVSARDARAKRLRATFAVVATAALVVVLALAL